MNDARRLGTLKPVSVNMAHDIMADHLLSGLGVSVVYILRVLLKLGYLLVCNGQSQLLFRLRKSYPQLSPCPELSNYLRPYEKVNTSTVFDGYHWKMAHYLSPLRQTPKFA